MGRHPVVQRQLGLSPESPPSGAEVRPALQLGTDVADEVRVRPGPRSAGPATEPARQPSFALAKTMGLAALVATASLIVVVGRFRSLRAPAHGLVPWWLLAAGFALAEVLVFHIEVRQEAVTFSLSELPLTLGLFLAAPTTLVIGRVVGGLVVQALRERRVARKIVLNGASFAAECTAAVIVFRAVPVHHDPGRPEAWLAVLAGVAAAGAVTFVMVSLAMRWHGARVDVGGTLLTSTLTITTNTALGILAAVLVVTNRAAALLLAFVGGIVVVSYRGYSSLSRRYASLRLLYDFTRLVSGSKRPDDVLDSMLGSARQLLRAEKAALVLDGPAGALWLEGDSERAVPRALPSDLLRGVGAGGRAVVVGRHTRDPDRRALLDALGAKDCIVAPMVEGARPIGVLLVIDRETDVSTFDAEDGRLFETLANHASVALENGRLIERLHDQALEREHEALHDALTGLPNRAHFLRSVGQAIDEAANHGGRFRVGLLDLDHFKEVNDTLGHHHGDLLLRAVAGRLAGHLPATTMLARLGGDEFALLVADSEPGQPALELGPIVRDAVAAPFAIKGLTLEIGASLGIALYPEHGTDPATLLQRADVAMYDAKASTTDRYEVYDPVRDVNTPRRLALANDLRAAIEAGALELHYQPKARLDDGLVHSVEGLIRWRHARYGNVPPDEFVPLAERTGLIQPFTHFVIEHGLSQLSMWNAAGIDVGMSLNLSMRNLVDASLPARVGDVLTATGVRPDRVTFEVTETSMMAEPTKATNTLLGLAELGVRLSIDDFGTGHSSLAYLQRLSVHEVKIDRSFVAPLAYTPASRSIVQSIVHLVHSLGLTVVAEGVEDEATWHALRQLGCDDLQGYFLARPMPAADLVGWLAEHAPDGRFDPRGRVLAPALSGAVRLA